MNSSPDEELTPTERALADRLSAQRPIPAAGFRGTLARSLAAEDPGYGPRPDQLRAIVTSYLLAALLLIALGALLALGTL